MKNNNSSGASVIGMLGVLFVTLKLTGCIGWSWWLVLLPFYGPAVIAVLVLGGFFALVAFVDYMAGREAGRRYNSFKKVVK